MTGAVDFSRGDGRVIEFQTAWGAQVATYLFLGGLSAGMFIMSSILSFIRRKRYRRTIVYSKWVSVICLSAGLVCLLSELIKPQKALDMWQSFSHFGSWMAFGAWCVLCALITFVVASLLSTNAVFAFIKVHIPAARGHRRTICGIADGIGCALALCVAAYTGVLLKSAPGIPFWNSLFIPALFTVSSLGAGVNAVAIMAVITKDRKKVTHQKRRILSLAVMGTICLEAAFLCVFLATMVKESGLEGAQAAQQAAANASAALLLNGCYAWAFWGLVIICGLVSPLLCGLASFFIRGKRGWAIVTAGAACALAGECALRFLILFAGAHADIIGDAVGRILT